MSTEREWKPGDVVVIEGFSEGPRAAMTAVRREAAGRALQFVYADGSGFDMVDDLAPGFAARPLVAIDPEDREQVERLYMMFVAIDTGDATEDMQAALRSLIEPPKPPKPEEPTGLGAVVEDSKGRRWVRTYCKAETSDYECWKQQDLTTRVGWSKVDAIKILSEGVPS